MVGVEFAEEERAVQVGGAGRRSAGRGGPAMNSYVKDSPGRIHSWPTSGTPSLSLVTFSTPCQCIVCGSVALLTRMTRTRSPSVTRIVGAGTRLLKLIMLIVTPGRIS